MNNTAKFSCCIDTTDPSANLGIEIWLDDLCMYNNDHVTAEQTLLYEINDDEGDHEFRFVMKNKNINHTKLDEQGNILKDACLILKNVAFEGNDLGHMLIEQASYTHDFNGTKEKVTEKFYGSMGCNGTVRLEFTTPFYMWLLEHM